MPRFFTSSAGAVWSSLTSPGRRMHCVIPRKKTGISVPPDFFYFFVDFELEVVNLYHSLQFFDVSVHERLNTICVLCSGHLRQTSAATSQSFKKHKIFTVVVLPAHQNIFFFFFRVSASLAPGYLTQVLFRWKIKAKTWGVGFSSTLVPSAPKNLFGKKNMESTNVGFEL